MILHPGWNLVGATENISIDNLPQGVETVKDFEKWNLKGNALSTLQELTKGKAYLIKK